MGRVRGKFSLHRKSLRESIERAVDGGDQWGDLDSVVGTAAVASVVSAVFGDGVSPFVRAGGAGNTFGPVDMLS